MHDGAPRLTFFWRRQWKMKMNIPCRVLKMVKRYAITMEESLRKSRPKDQVSPSRQRRTNAPDTHDLWNTGDPDERAQRRTFLLLLVKKKKKAFHISVRCIQDHFFALRLPGIPGGKRITSQSLPAMMVGHYRRPTATQRGGRLEWNRDVNSSHVGGDRECR